MSNHGSSHTYLIIDKNVIPVTIVDKLNAKDFIWVTSEPCKCATCERIKRARK